MKINEYNTIRRGVKTHTQKQPIDTGSNSKVVKFAKPVLTRRHSLSELPKLVGKEQAVKEKMGHMWFCKDRWLDKYGGFIYSYEFDEKYRNYSCNTKKNDELYPAVEPTLSSMINRIGGVNSFVHYFEESVIDDYLNMDIIFVEIQSNVNNRLKVLLKEKSERLLDQQSDRFINEFLLFKTNHLSLVELCKESIDIKCPGEIFVEKLLMPFLEEYLPDTLDLSESITVKILEHVREKQLKNWKNHSKSIREFWDSGLEKRSKKRRFFHSLGYNCKLEGRKTIIFLPDGKALSARLKKMREENPKFPEINIDSAAGIESDIKFVEKFFTHDVLLSLSEEHIHDQGGHVTVLLNQLCDPEIAKCYEDQKQFYVKEYKKNYKKLKLAKKQALKDGDLRLKKACEIYAALLGLSVDVHSNKSIYVNSKSWNPDKALDESNIDLKKFIPNREGSNLEFFRRRLKSSMPLSSRTEMSKDEVIAKLEWACDLVEGS